MCLGVLELHADAGQVGVRHAGGQVERLTGPQPDVVEQHADDHAAVVREVLGDPGVRGVLAVRVRPGERRDGLPDGPLGGRVVHGEHGGQGAAQRLGLGLVVPGVLDRQQLDQRLQSGHREGGQQRGRRGGPAEAAQSLELAQRADHFGLVVGIAVAALGGVQRESEGVLGGEAGPGLVQRGVGLDGQRQARGEHLEQEGQARTEAGRARRAEFALGVGRDQLVQPSRTLAAVGAGRVAGVGAHPQLGLRLTGGLLPQQLGQGRERPPGVRADGVDEPVHARGPTPSLTGAAPGRSESGSPGRARRYGRVPARARASTLADPGRPRGNGGHQVGVRWSYQRFPGAVVGCQDAVVSALRSILHRGHPVGGLSAGPRSRVRATVF